MSLDQIPLLSIIDQCFNRLDTSESPSMKFRWIWLHLTEVDETWFHLIQQSIHYSICLTWCSFMMSTSLKICILNWMLLDLNESDPLNQSSHINVIQFDIKQSNWVWSSRVWCSYILMTAFESDRVESDITRILTNESSWVRIKIYSITIPQWLIGWDRTRKIHRQRNEQRNTQLSW